MVIKMSKRLIFVFSADDSKTSVSVWASERSYLALSENAMDYWVLSYIRKISALENILFWFFLFFCFGWLSSFFYISISRKVATKPINYTIFWKNSIRFFMCTLIFSLYLIPSYPFREGNLEELDKQASKCYIQQHHWQVLLLFCFVLLFCGGFFHFIF